MILDPCPDYLPLLARAADGVLTTEERKKLDGHLSTCAVCRAMLVDQTEVHRLVAAVPRVEASPFFATRVRARLAAEPASGIWSVIDFRRWTWRLAPATAALALAVVLVARATPATPAVNDDFAVVVSADDLPASAALWSESVSDTSLLGILLQADADDPLADALESVQ